MTVYTEDWLPPAHAAVQLVQVLQVPVQFTGQGVGLMQLVVDLGHEEHRQSN